MATGQSRPSGPASIIGRIFNRPYGILARDAGVADRPPVETRVTACRMCGNKAWCTAIIRIQDGVVVGIEGDPSNPVSQGKLCSRGQAAIFNLYNPYRVKAPMKRTNPR